MVAVLNLVQQSVDCRLVSNQYWVHVQKLLYQACFLHQIHLNLRTCTRFVCSPCSRRAQVRMYSLLSFLPCEWECGRICFKPNCTCTLCIRRRTPYRTVTNECGSDASLTMDRKWRAGNTAICELAAKTETHLHFKAWLQQEKGPKKITCQPFRHNNCLFKCFMMYSYLACRQMISAASEGYFLWGGGGG